MQRCSLQSQHLAYTRTQWAMGGGLLLLLIGLYLFGFRPAASRAAALDEQTKAKRIELDAAEVRTRDLKTVEAEVEKLQARLARFDKRLPSQRDLGQEYTQFYRDITQLKQQGAMKKISVQPGVLRRADAFAELPISMNIEGDFPSVAAFLQQMELMPRLTRVKSLVMKSKDSKMGQVEAQVSMNLYFADN